MDLQYEDYTVPAKHYKQVIHNGKIIAYFVLSQKGKWDLEPDWYLEPVDEAVKEAVIKHGRILNGEDIG